jgi:hypothetical protein
VKQSRHKQLQEGFVRGTGSSATQDTEPPVTDKNIQSRLSSAEHFLTMPENKIRQYAKEHGFNSSLPVAALQEEIFTSTVTQHETKYGGYTPEKVAQIKDQFIEAIGEAYFIGLAAQRAGVPRKLVTAWLKTDLDFAERVYERQSLMAEKVGVTLLAEGIHQKDTASLMFLIKQFGDVFQKPIQENFDEMHDAVNPLGDISRLSIEEQQLLLHLLRKSKTSDSTGTAFAPSVFDESDPDIEILEPSNDIPALSHDSEQFPQLPNAIPKSLLQSPYPLDPPR